MKWVNEDDDDEKKMEDEVKSEMDSPLILCKPDQIHYQYTFRNLQRNKKYIYNLHLYEQTVMVRGNRMHNIHKLVHKFDNASLIIKTKQYDLNNQHFAYSTDYDKNGVIYFLGTNYRTNTEWKNPSKLGKIALDSSGWSFKQHHIGAMISVTKNMYYLTEQDALCVMTERTKKHTYSKITENAWVTINFKSIRIKPTQYTLRHFDYPGY